MPSIIASPFLSLKVEEFTPHVAREYVSTTIKNREVDWDKVFGYAAEMDQGIWNPYSRYVEFTIEGDLINGRHRLLAIIESGIPQTMVVVRGLPVCTR